VDANAAYRYEVVWGQDGRGRTVVLAETHGPNVSPVKVCRTRVGARFAAWRRNRGS